MKKILSVVLLILGFFSFFACKKTTVSSNELELNQIINKAYLKEALKKPEERKINKFDFEELKTSKIKKINSSGKITLFKTMDLEDPETHESRDRLLFINTLGEKKVVDKYIYNPMDEIELFENYIRIFTKDEESNEFNYIYSVISGAKIFELPLVKDKMNYEYDFSNDKIISVNTVSNARKIYTFKEGKLLENNFIDQSSNFSNDYSIYNYYVDNKLYDQINLLNNTKKEAFELANKDILFQQKEEVKKQEDQKFSELDFNYRETKYHPGLYKYAHFLYSYKDKSLKEIKLPFLIKSLTPNTIDNNLKIKKYADIVENISSIIPINQETKFAEENQLVNLSNQLVIKHSIKINSAYLNFLSEDQYFLKYYNTSNIQTFGKDARLIQGKHIIDTINNTHLLLRLPNTLTYQNDENTWVKLYDIKENKESKAYLLVKKIGNYFNDSYLLCDQNNTYYTLSSDGSLTKLNGKFTTILKYSVIITTDETKTYFYSIYGDLIKEVDKDVKFIEYKCDASTNKNSTGTITTYTTIVTLVYENDKHEEEYENFYYSFNETKLETTFYFS